MRHRLSIVVKQSFRPAINQARRARRLIRDQVAGHLPVIVANSFPKSGTNLLMQILGGLENVDSFVNTNRIIPTFRDGFERDTVAICTDLRLTANGDIVGGHLHAAPPVQRLLESPRYITFFMVRDPRDVVVSHAFYLTEMNVRHPHHHYYRSVLNTLDDRIRVSIVGSRDTKIELPSVDLRFEPYAQWLSVQGVLPVRFEDIRTDPKGCIEALVQHLEAQGCPNVRGARAREFMMAGMEPSRSKTFREGKTAGWKKHFNEEHKQLFKECAGDLLISLGYESSNDW